MSQVLGRQAMLQDQSLATGPRYIAYWAKRKIDAYKQRRGQMMRSAVQLSSSMRYDAVSPVTRGWPLDSKMRRCSFACCAPVEMCAKLWHLYHAHQQLVFPPYPQIPGLIVTHEGFCTQPEPVWLRRPEGA
eukprot:6397931-Amphidinium_carterae.1